jgi:hypothetical protein
MPASQGTPTWRKPQPGPLNLFVFFAHSLVLACAAGLFLARPEFGNGSERAAVNAFAASALGEEVTVGLMVCGGPRSWLNRDLGHHRSRLHCLVLGGDKPITEAERSQTAGTGCVSLGPVRGMVKALGLQVDPVRGQHGSNSRIANLLK